MQKFLPLFQENSKNRNNYDKTNSFSFGCWYGLTLWLTQADGWRWP
jgi:hypothetical protein